MYKEITGYLCCPKCRSGFSVNAQEETAGEVIEGTLLCEKGHAYRISEAVADFNSEEQGFANQWETMGEAGSFEELDRQMDDGSPETTLEQRRMVLKALTDAVSGQGADVVLDIASGRGMLLTELAKRLDGGAHIISTDLSAFVLRYDHKKLKRIAPDRRISYLACDASRLPIKDGVIDAAATYGGFSNMLGCAGEGIREAHRVLKRGGLLADSFVVIDRASKGYEVLKQVCSGQGVSGAEDFFLIEGVEKAHGGLFSEVGRSVVCEGVGEDNGMDLLPYEGEWYSEQVFRSRK